MIRPMRLSHWAGPVCLPFLLMATDLAFAIAGFESTDRPSEWRPGLPYYLPKKEDGNLTLPSPTEETQDPLAHSTKVSIKTIEFSGNDTIDREDIQGLIDEFIQAHEGLEDVPVSDLEALRLRITRLYADRGYINSGAAIDAFDPKRHRIHFQIVEGKLSDLVIRGIDGLDPDYIKARLLEDPNAAFNINDLQENFQLLLSDPLLEGMKGRIRPGDHPGEAVLDVEVQRAKSFGLTTFVDNYRPPSIGAIGIGGSGWIRNLTGLGDALQMTIVGSNGSERYAGGYSMPLFGSKLLGYINFDEGNSSVVESSFQNLNIKSLVHIEEAGASYPLIENLKRRLVLGGSFSVRANNTTLLGEPYSFVPGVTGGYTQVTVARSYQDYTERWERHALSVRNTLSFGMHALDSTPANGTYPSSQFVSWLFQSQYAYRLNDEGAQFIFKDNLQLTNNALLPLERIAVGGVSTVRGYRTNYLVRDEGFTLSGEVRYPLPSFEIMGQRSVISMIPFMDYGSAWNLGGPRNSLWSVGAGLSWSYMALLGELYYGYALNPPSYRGISDAQDNGLFFRVTFEAL